MTLLPASTMPLTAKQRRVIAAIVIAGGASGLRSLRTLLRQCITEQQGIMASAGLDRKGSRRTVPKVAVDAVFARRLQKILKICVPGPLSAEAGLIYTQTILLVARTFLTDISSQIEGGVGRYIISADGPRLRRLLGLFCGVAVPAALVNSALKYIQKRIKLAFMRRLTLHLHEMYCSHRAYYAASWLGGLSAADQRLTEDVEKFR
jgi:hypothetical protein